MRLLTEVAEWEIFSRPNVTVEVTPLFAAPGGGQVADAEIFFSESPDPLSTALLPATVIGQITNFDGTIELQLDEVTCHASILYLVGQLRDVDTDEIVVISNEVAIGIKKGIGTDDPECIFQDTDLDGNGTIDPDEEGDPIGGEGCDDEFWKRCAERQDADHCSCRFPIPLAPGTLFEDIFDDAFPGASLADVLCGTASENTALAKLGAETVASLLNAQSTLVDHDLSVAQVIMMFDDAFPGTDIEYDALRAVFESFNDLGDSSLCDFVRLDFETQDDFLTPLVNGEKISSPPDFGELVEINGLGNDNFGTAIFDSDTGGPNDPGADNDLLVDLGNIVILQEDGAQTVPGIFDSPDDAQLGGTMVFEFVDPAELLCIDMIDICPGHDTALTLYDQQENTRTYLVPGGWTSDVSVEGAGYGTLDLTTLDDQEGFDATATASETEGFAAADVVRLEIFFSSSGAMDNLEFDATPEPVEEIAPDPKKTKIRRAQSPTPSQPSRVLKRAVRIR